MTVRTQLLAAARWLALVVPLVDVALVLTGVLSLRTGIAVALVLEALLAVVLVVEAAAFPRASRAAWPAAGRPRGGLVAGAGGPRARVGARLARARGGGSSVKWRGGRRRS